MGYVTRQCKVNGVDMGTHVGVTYRAAAIAAVEQYILDGNEQKDRYEVSITDEDGENTTGSS